MLRGSGDLRIESWKSEHKIASRIIELENVELIRKREIAVLADSFGCRKAAIL